MAVADTLICTRGLIWIYAIKWTATVFSYKVIGFLIFRFIADFDAHCGADRFDSPAPLDPVSVQVVEVAR